MNHKILILSLGAVREKQNHYVKNLQKLKNSLEINNNKVDILFSTWEPISNPKYFFIESIYEHNFSREDLKIELEKSHIKYFFLSQPNGKNITKLKNNAPSFSFYHLIQSLKYIHELGMKYDFIVKTRHDLNIEIHEIERHLKKKLFKFNIKIFIPEKNYWSDFKNAINDHFFIADYDLIISKSLKYITNPIIYQKIIKKSWDMEDLFKRYYKSLAKIDFIKDHNIKAYEVLEFGYKNQGKKFK